MGRSSLSTITTMNGCPTVFICAGVDAAIFTVGILSCAASHLLGHDFNKILILVAHIAAHADHVVKGLVMHATQWHQVPIFLLPIVAVFNVIELYPIGITAYFEGFCMSLIETQLT